MYDHLKRYGTRGKRDDVPAVEVVCDGVAAWKGKRWDLRTGEPTGKSVGFAFGADGRHLVFGDNGGCVMVHADGRRVPLEGSAGMFVPVARHVGDTLVFSVQGHQEPWRVVDANTGARRGSLEGQRKDARLHMYYPSLFDPRDGRQLWLGEGEWLRAFDVTTMSWSAEVPMPPGTRAVGFAVGLDGNLAVFARPLGVTNDNSQDALVLLDGKGAERGRAAALGPSMGIARLGPRFLVVEHSAMRFRIFDSALADVEAVSMMPDSDWAQLAVFPSEREWLAIGGFGQWDHYGEPQLGPPHASRVIDAPAENAAAKSAAKPAAKKGAAKKR